MFSLSDFTGALRKRYGFFAVANLSARICRQDPGQIVKGIGSVWVIGAERARRSYRADSSSALPSPARSRWTPSC